MCNEIVGVNGDEGTPVPIPNTVVKLVYGDNTWLATAREDNSTPTSKAATKVAAFCFNHFSCELEVKLGVRGSVRTGMLFAAISTGGSAMQLLPMLLSISPLADRGKQQQNQDSTVQGLRLSG